MPTATLPDINAVTPVRAKADTVLVSQETQDAARAALADLTAPADVGKYVGAVMEGPRLATLAFACELPGYRGWFWTVTVSRVPRARVATICETELLPGDDALLAKVWVPWSERLQPGDLGAGDVLPYSADDQRLEAGTATAPAGTVLPPDADDAQQAVVALGLGMERTLSPEGRAQAAQRWWDGPGGPKDPVALKAKAHCASCGFLVPLAPGTLSQLFGVCSNEWSPSDGRVVALTHGCGAHSQTDVPRAASEWPSMSPLLDDDSVELFSFAAPQEPGQLEEPAPAPQPVAEPAAPDDQAKTRRPAKATRGRDHDPARAEREVAAAVAELFAAAALLRQESPAGE